MMTWLLTYLLHSTLLIGAVWLAVRLGIRSAAWRDILWKTALTAPILTATLQLAIPALPSEVPVRTPAPHVAAPQFTPSPIVTPIITITPAKPSVERSPVLLGFWIAVAALLLARLVWRLQELDYRLRDRQHVTRRDLIALLDRMAEAAGVMRPALTSSGALPTPVALAGNEIVLPEATLDELTVEQQESILAHEFAHLHRRDPQWLRLTEVLKALLFFQPLVIPLQRLMKTAAEELCDDAAIVWTGKKLPLAESLTAIGAAAIDSRALATPAMIENGSSLVSRVARVLHPTRKPEKPVGAIGKVALVSVICGVTIAYGPGVVREISAAALPDGVRGGVEGGVAGGVDGGIEGGVEGGVQGGVKGAVSSNRSENDTTDDGEVRRIGKARYELRKNGARVTIDAKGATVRLNPGAIESIDPGGWFRVREESHALDMTADSAGRVQASYRVNGVEVPFEPVGATFLRSVLTTQPFLEHAGRCLLDVLAKRSGDGGTTDLSLRYSNGDQKIVMRGERIRIDDDGRVSLAAGGSFFLSETTTAGTREVEMEWMDGREVHSSRGLGNLDPDAWVRSIIRNRFPDLTR
jgi:beta-lactamase regulating signal transducer with metallopeptidase domain